jgi:hypothetical protein
MDAPMAANAGAGRLNPEYFPEGASYERIPGKAKRAGRRKAGHQ